MRDEDQEVEEQRREEDQKVEEQRWEEGWRDGERSRTRREGD